MRNLKRALSLALASIMMLSLMVVGAGAVSYDDFSDKDKIVNTEAVNTMVSLGVINGKDDGSYDPTGIVTRAEMCKLICYALNGGKDPVLGTSSASFTDTKGHWAEAYIAYCVNMGIVAGQGDGSFKPNDPVTGTAAAKMFLCALGYRADLEELVGVDWAMNTNILANKVKLYDNLDAMDPDAGMSRDNAAQLVYNGVQAYEVKYNNLFGEHSDIVQTTNNGTMLANRFGVRKVTGIVAANDLMSVDGSVAVAKEGYIRMNNGTTPAIGDSSSSVNFEDGTAFKVAAPNSMVGREIVIYVKFQNDLAPNASSSTVIGTPILSERNAEVVTTGKLKNADKVKDALKDAGLTVKSGTTEEVLFTEDTTAYSGTTMGIQTVPGVTQTFIDNNNDGVVEYILQEKAALSKVSVYNTKDEKLTLTGIGSIDFDDVKGYEDVSKEDYVLVTNYNGTYVVTAAETVSGTVESYNSSNEKITIDGESYAVGAGADKTNDLDALPTLNDMVDSEYTLYLDGKGNFLAIKEGEAAIGNYAVITASTGDPATGFSSGKVKLLLADGTTGTYTVNLLASAKKWSSSVNTGSNSAKESSMASALDGSLAGTIVSYSIADDNTVTIGQPDYINANKYDTDSSSSTITFQSSKSSYTFDNDKVVANSGTIFFFKDASGNYSVVNGLGNLRSSGIATTSGNFGDVIFYQASSSATRVAKAIYAEVSGTYTSSSNFAFVSDKYRQINEDGDDIYVYPIITEEGETGELKSKEIVASGKAYEYQTDSKGYAEFSAAQTVNDVIVTYADKNSVALADKDNYAVDMDSYPIAKGAKIWDVEDTDNVYDSSLSKNSVVALVLNDDDEIRTAFVTDVKDGDMTVAATIGFDNSLSMGQNGDSGTVTAASGTQLKLTVDFADGQEASFTVTKASGSLGGTIIAKGDLTDNTPTLIYTLGTESSGVITVTVTVKDASGVDLDRVCVYEITVANS